MNMKKSVRTSTLVTGSTVLIIILLIKIATFYPAWVEEKFSRGVYPYIATFCRQIFGKLFFSLGDVIYFITGLFLLLGVVKFSRIVINRRVKFLNYKRFVTKVFFVCAIIYILFNVLWGLNYNRLGIGTQLGLQAESHSVNDLKSITSLLVAKVNEKRLALKTEKIDYPAYPQIFYKAQLAYQAVASDYDFLQYRTASVKPSLYGHLGNFLGFLGYYNPFTGEAQLNLTQPKFLIPFVTCHEMGHQLGYASESEASFVAYLAAIKSADTLFHYSTYFDLFAYANRELFLRDSVAAKKNYNELDTLVKQDVIELRQYWRKSENFVTPLIRTFYDQYLKANQQDKGLQSYNEVIGLLIAYYKKYHRL
jgi:hypothetical protein